MVRNWFAADDLQLQPDSARNCRYLTGSLAWGPAGRKTAAVMRPRWIVSLVSALLISICGDGCTHDRGSADARGGDEDAISVRSDQGLPDRGTGPAVPLRLATFNVHNLFDDTDDPDKSDELLSSSQVSVKLSALGKALRLLDADVLALQEVENVNILERLVAAELADMGYVEVRLLEGNDPRGIDVALLSRLPVKRLTSHRGDSFPGAEAADTERYWFSRDCLEAVVEPRSGLKLTLLINHLRANDWNDKATADRVRRAQAKRVRGIADATLDWEPGAKLAVLGDMNDAPESQVVALIKAGEVPLVGILEGTKGSSRYTYSDAKSQLDYIFVAPGLLADLKPNSARARHDAAFAGASDHFPVVVDFELR